MADPRDDERGGQEFPLRENIYDRDPLARYKVLDSLFVRIHSDVDMAYRRRLTTDLANWFETRPEGPEEESAVILQAYEIVSGAEMAYPGDVLWDTLRVMVATDLLRAGSAESAGLILSTCPDAKRAVEQIAAVTDSCMERGRQDLLPEVDIAYDAMVDRFAAADPELARMTHRYMRNYFIATFPEVLDEPNIAFDTELAIGHDDYDSLADWAEIAAEDMPDADWPGLVELIRDDEAWSADVPQLLRQHLGLLLAYAQQGFSGIQEVTIDDANNIDNDILSAMRPAMKDEHQLGRLRAMMAGYLRQNGHEIAADHLVRER